MTVNPPASGTDPTRPPAFCTLCGLPVRGRTDGFCCTGCRRVHEILRELVGADDPAALRAHPVFQRMVEAGIVPRTEGDVLSADVAPPPEPEIPPGEEAEQRVFRVEGMWCPSCAWVIERALSRREGVLGATASFASDRLRVTYLPRLISPEKIGEAVDMLGYRIIESEAEQEHGRRAQGELARLGVAVVLSMNVMMLAFGLYQGFFIEIPRQTARLLGIPMLALSTIVIFYGGYPILDRALRAARARAFVMETLIALGALAAYFLSVANLVRDDLHQYFDTATMLVALVLLGKFLEGRIRAQAARGVEEIHALVPTKARMVTDSGNRWVAIEGVSAGDRVSVREGEPVPVDGTVTAGRGILDESKLTGETRPRTRGPGETVLAGSTLVSGEITLLATGVGRASAIGRMVRLMEDAMLRRNPFERTADRLMSFFVPAVIVLALGTAALLLASGRPVHEALVRAVTVLVIACPCALGIAVPLAKVAAVGRARREGILVVNAEALETAARLDVLVLDKTGTATRGEFRVREVLTEGAGEAEVLSLAARAEAGSSHPIARAIRERSLSSETGAAPGTRSPAPAPDELSGLGVRAMVDGHRVHVGNLRLMEQDGVDVPPDWRFQAEGWSRAGDTAVFVASDGIARGLLRLGDEIRPDMTEAVATLRREGISVRLLSGDSPEATAHVAAVLGADAFEGGVLPDGKVARVRALQERGLRVGVVGDGANDAAALAAADVGIATGDALTVTKHASDLTLLSFSGEKLLSALALARRTVRTIRINLALALIYNVAALPLAVLGLVNPIVAVLAMLVSSLTVVTHSARLARAGGAVEPAADQCASGSPGSRKL